MVLAFEPLPACAYNEYCRWNDGGELPLGSCQLCVRGICATNDNDDSPAPGQDLCSNCGCTFKYPCENGGYPQACDQYCYTHAPCCECTPCQQCEYGIIDGYCNSTTYSDTTQCAGPTPVPPTSTPNPSGNNFCGTTWLDADLNCQTCHRCQDQDDECPAGQHCYAGITCTAFFIYV